MVGPGLEPRQPGSGTMSATIVLGNVGDFFSDEIGRIQGGMAVDDFFFRVGFC